MTHQEWLDDRFALLRLAALSGYPRFDSLMLLADLVAHFRPRSVLELGTYLGCSAVFIARALEPGATLTCIDSFDDHRQDVVEVNLKKFGVRTQVSLVKGDTREAGKLVSGKYDFVFFDASHISDDLLKEYEAVIPRLDRPAVLVIDDYGSSLEALHRMGKYHDGMKTYPVHFGMCVIVRP